MDLSAFFYPLSGSLRELVSVLPTDSLGVQCQRFETSFPAWESADLILIGCEIDMETYPRGHTSAIRHQLYGLTHPGASCTIADLGDLRPRSSLEAACEALAFVLSHLQAAGKTIVILGSAPELAWGQYLSYENADRLIEYVEVSSRLHMADHEVAPADQAFNHNILTHRPGWLFQYTNLGYQTYFVPESLRTDLREQGMLLQRYGELAAALELAEPPLRTADMVTFHLGSVRHADAPAGQRPSPGGFTAMEICRLARYAGMGHRPATILVSGWNPDQDLHHQTALLGALMVWYIAEGILNRKDDMPREDRSVFRHYEVQVNASIPPMVFYCHPHTGRWWMEVPYPEALGQRKVPARLVACAEQDYQTALADDIPERWWVMFQRLSAGTRQA
ncbi:MAG: hypothetical protein SF053_08080 [Bacteroidia bacterium]|nr:hypothetical protein [Bacteroidia bacterium]